MQCMNKQHDALYMYFEDKTRLLLLLKFFLMDFILGSSIKMSYSTAVWKTKLFSATSDGFSTSKHSCQHDRKFVHRVHSADTSMFLLLTGVCIRWQWKASPTCYAFIIHRISLRCVVFYLFLHHLKCIKWERNNMQCRRGRKPSGLIWSLHLNNVEITQTQKWTYGK